MYEYIEQRNGTKDNLFYNKKKKRIFLNTYIGIYKIKKNIITYLPE